MLLWIPLSLDAAQRRPASARQPDRPRRELCGLLGPEHERAASLDLAVRLAHRKVPHGGALKFESPSNRYRTTPETQHGLWRGAVMRSFRKQSADAPR